MDEELPLKLRFRGFFTRRIQRQIWRLLWSVDPVERRDMWAVALGVGAVSLVLPVIPAIVISLLFDAHANLGVMEALAGALPVIALAAIVDQGLSLRAYFDRDARESGPIETREWQGTMTMAAGSTYQVAAYFLVGESAALISLAMGRATTFLVVTASTSGLLLVLRLVRSHVLGLDEALRIHRAESPRPTSGS